MDVKQLLDDLKREDLNNVTVYVKQGGEYLLAKDVYVDADGDIIISV